VLKSRDWASSGGVGGNEIGIRPLRAEPIRFAQPWLDSPVVSRRFLLYIAFLWQEMPKIPSRGPGLMNDAILTIPEVAELLRIAEKTVYALAQRGEIPAFKVGGQWRFSRGAIQAWIDERSRAGHHPSGESTSGSASDAPAARRATKTKTRRRR
jgi:excisionase family DNA binding protein